MNEKQLERKCCRHAEGMGWQAIKLTSPGRVGVPDRVLVGPESQVLWVEFKAPGGHLSPMQERCVDSFGKLGHTVFVIYTLHQFESMMRIPE